MALVDLEYAAPRPSLCLQGLDGRGGHFSSDWVAISAESGWVGAHVDWGDKVSWLQQVASKLARRNMRGYAHFDNGHLADSKDNLFFLV